MENGYNFMPCWVKQKGLFGHNRPRLTHSQKGRLTNFLFTRGQMVTDLVQTFLIWPMSNGSFQIRTKAASRRVAKFNNTRTRLRSRFKQLWIGIMNAVVMYCRRGVKSLTP